MSKLGALLGVDKTSVMRWEQGGNPGSDHLRRLSEELNVSADWLLFGTGDGPQAEAS